MATHTSWTVPQIATSGGLSRITQSDSQNAFWTSDGDTSGGAIIAVCIVSFGAGLTAFEGGSTGMHRARKLGKVGCTPWPYLMHCEPRRTFRDDGGSGAVDRVPLTGYSVVHKLERAAHSQPPSLHTTGGSNVLLHAHPTRSPMQHACSAHAVANAVHSSPNPATTVQCGV